MSFQGQINFFFNVRKSRFLGTCRLPRIRIIANLDKEGLSTTIYNTVICRNRSI